MVEIALERSALAMSFFWELLALPFHAGRLAALRLASQRRQYEFAQSVQQEQAAFREVLRVAREMERELAESDLSLGASRRLAVAALRGALARLKVRVAGDLPGDSDARQEAA